MRALCESAGRRHPVSYRNTAPYAGRVCPASRLGQAETGSSPTTTGSLVGASTPGRGSTVSATTEVPLAGSRSVNVPNPSAETSISPAEIGTPSAMYHAW